MTQKDDGVIILHQQPGIHFIYGEAFKLDLCSVVKQIMPLMCI